MAKYKGKDLSFLFGTQEVNVEATVVRLDNEEADNDAVTFAELSQGGGRQWFLEVEAVSDYGTSSLWTYLWDNAGDEVTFTFKPYGNTTATASQPHFTGTCVLGPKPSVGGEAGEVFAFEYRADVVGEPVKKVA